MTDQQLLERVLDFWGNCVAQSATADELRRQLVELLFEHRARGMNDAADTLKKARRQLGGDGVDAVTRYVLARVEEEVRRRAAGIPPKDDVGQWLRDTPTH